MHPGTFEVMDGDCDDADPRVFPGAPERCDGVRQDCSADVADVGALCDVSLTESACIGGRCEVVGCPDARGNCDGSLRFCETDLTTDPTSCGRCGNACAGGLACVGGVCEGAPTEVPWMMGVDLDHYFATGSHLGGEVFVAAGGAFSETVEFAPGLTSDIVAPFDVVGPPPGPDADDFVFLDIKPNRPSPTTNFRWVTVNRVLASTVGYIPTYLRHEELVELETMAREAPDPALALVAMVMPHSSGVIDWDSAGIAPEAAGGTFTLGSSDTDIRVWVNVPIDRFLSPTPPTGFRIEGGAGVSAQGKVTLITPAPL